MEEVEIRQTSHTAAVATSAEQVAGATGSLEETSADTQVMEPDAAAVGQQDQPAENAQENPVIQPSGTAQPDATGQIQQPQQQPQQLYQLPPGYAVDPATGQAVFIGTVAQQPMQPGYIQPGVVYAQPQATPEQIAAQQAAAQQRYGLVINSVEQFFEGEATVTDVVKTLYTNTTQDDQLWKGAIVGAAAAVLLTSDPVRKAMGKTLGGIFPGLKQSKQPVGAAASAGKSTTEPLTTDKE